MFHNLLRNLTQTLQTELDRSTRVVNLSPGNLPSRKTDRWRKDVIARRLDAVLFRILDEFKFRSEHLNHVQNTMIGAYHQS
jgi:hypothetical protein